MLLDGKKIAQLQQCELDLLAEKWAASIVMYVVGDIPKIASVNRYISSNWTHVKKPTVYLHDAIFSFNFVLLMIKMRLSILDLIRFLVNQ